MKNELWDRNPEDPLYQRAPGGPISQEKIWANVGHVGQNVLKFQHILILWPECPISLKKIWAPLEPACRANLQDFCPISLKEIWAPLEPACRANLQGFVPYLSLFFIKKYIKNKKRRKREKKERKKHIRVFLSTCGTKRPENV